jgi:mannose-6-phosphate isomerase-like protein (cupin superfamily)
MTLNASALPARPFVETEDSAPRFWQIGILWRALATGIKTGGSLCILDEVVGDEPGGPVTHLHPMDECFYLVDGACAVFAGGDTFHCGPGSFISVPRYTQHAFMADAGSRLLNFYLPAGFEMLLMGLAAPAERNDPPRPDDQVKMPPRYLVDKLASDYGQISVLGTPFADPPDPTRMKTEPLADALATPFTSTVKTAPAYWSQGILWSVLADAKTTDGSYVLFEELCPAGSGAPPHVHLYTDEVFYILDGTAEFVAGDKRETVGKGSLVFIPRGTVHAFKVRSDTARMLNLYSQAGFERIIELNGQRTDQRTVPPADFQAPEVSKVRQAELFAELGMLPVAMPPPFAD